MIRLKSEKDIERLAKAGKYLKEVLVILQATAVPGVTGKELDQMATEEIRRRGCEPAFLNYAPKGHRPFPAALCVSVNEAVVHGLPMAEQFREGDVVGLDLGLILEGKYYVDSAITVAAGKTSAAAGELIRVTQEALKIGIAAAKPGARTGDVGAAIQAYVEGYKAEANDKGFGVVRELVGHGVGFDVHEEPQVPNFGRAGTGERLKPGLVIAIEPMVTIGHPAIGVARDGWAVVAKSGELAAHFEHTIAITDKGARILTD